MKEGKEKYYLEKFKDKHGDRWEYLGFIKKLKYWYIKILCKEHGEYVQRIDSHLRGSICLKCSDNSGYEFGYEKFVARSKEIHGDEYLYPNQKVRTMKSYVDIFCKKHGEFKQTAHNHIVNGNKCPKCVNENRSKPSDIRILEISKNLRKVYKGTNIEVPSNINYINNRSIIQLVCKTHGNFEINYLQAIRGQGCVECNKQRKLKIDSIKFIEKSKEIWGDIFDYSDVNFMGNKKLVNIKYNGVLYRQTPQNHIRKHSPINNKSNGEIKIEHFLEKNNIKFEKQKTFKDCKNSKVLRFDFYIPEYGICIEYNGIQHYKPIDRFGGNKRLKYQIINDNIKFDFCKNNNMEFIVIPYLKFKCIEDIISKKLKINID